MFKPPLLKVAKSATAEDRVSSTDVFRFKGEAIA
jgi:hypothetical protein